MYVCLLASCLHAVKETRRNEIENENKMLKSENNMPRVVNKTPHTHTQKSLINPSILQHECFFRCINFIFAGQNPCNGNDHKHNYCEKGFFSNREVND